MAIFKKIDNLVDSAASLIGGPIRQEFTKAALYFLLLFIVVGIPYSLVRHVQTSGYHVVSVAREIRIGEEYSRKIEKKTTLLSNDDPRAKYVEEIGESVARLHNPWKAQFTFDTIEDMRTINAFALPGGKIYITTGMLNNLDNEAELAAVLAHEVAHVSRRHYARNLGRQMLVSWVKKFLGGTDETIMDTGSFLTANFAFLKMRWGDDLEADRFGMLWFFEFCYDPSASVTMWVKLLKLEEKLPDYAKALALTHPPSRERIQAMKDLSESFYDREGLILGEKRYRKIVNPTPHPYFNPRPKKLPARNRADF